MPSSTTPNNGSNKSVSDFRDREQEIRGGEPLMKNHFEGTYWKISKVGYCIPHRYFMCRILKMQE